jgi:AcrR family transcriptional regulator
MQIERPTLYYFFVSKKGLIMAVIKSLWNKCSRQNDELIASLECLPPAERLHRIFTGGIRAAIQNVEDMRFIFRYSLFPPEELKDDIKDFVVRLQSQKRVLADACIRECITGKIINVGMDKACQAFYKLINYSMFEVVFFNWRPDEAELLEFWDIFFKGRLMGSAPYPDDTTIG